jgi:hypothetical protein
MPTLYVARSASTSQWGSDVGLSKHVFKVGVTDEDPKEVVARGWAGATDWTLVKQQETDLTEAEAIERLARKEKVIDPNLYPRLKGATGVFKVLPAHVENQMMVQRALAGASEELKAVKAKPADFADYLIRNAQPK